MWANGKTERFCCLEIDNDLEFRGKRRTGRLEIKNPTAAAVVHEAEADWASKRRGEPNDVFQRWPW